MVVLKTRAEKYESGDSDSLSLRRLSATAYMLPRTDNEDEARREAARSTGEPRLSNPRDGPGLTWLSASF